MANTTINNAAGEPISIKNRLLNTGAAMAQPLEPVKQICAHLNAFHVYAAEPGRAVEANHYCTPLNEDVRQCLIYDAPHANARLIGVEYMISARLYEKLPEEERHLWHSHVYEVKSGMLIMPTPSGVPTTAWEAAETSEMREVIRLYGKKYHFWQVDRGDTLPLGAPQLMMAFTEPSQFNIDKMIGKRDEKFGVDYRHKAEIRQDLIEPKVHGGQTQIAFGEDRLFEQSAEQEKGARFMKLELE